MKNSVILMIVCVLLMAACGQSYEETKRQKSISKREAMRKDSAALKVAVMPTLDCLPLYVAEHYQLFDTLRGGVRLKFYMAQMDCDTALQRGRVEGAMTDLVRAKRMERQGMKLRYPAVTGAYWQLIANRNARVKQLKQMDDKMVAMTRFSATDLLTDRMIDSVKLDKDRVYKVQINDVSVRLLMLQNNEMDVLWMMEPQATAARMMKNGEQEMRHPERAEQLKLFMQAYDQACDSINKYGVRHYRDIIAERCQVKQNMLDSLPDKIKYERARGPRERDIALVEKWLGVKKEVSGKKKDVRSKR